MSDLLKALRPHQWAKNLLVFAAGFAASVADEWTAQWRMLLAFVCFSAASSAGYLLNDVRDIESDRRHPTKWARQIASGLVSETTAMRLAVALAAGSVLVALLVDAQLAGVLALYLMSSGSYSLGAKRIPYVEILIVGFGFVLRAFGGAIAANVDSSAWFLWVVAAAGVLVAARKRWCEWNTGSAATRPVLASYSHTALNLLSLGAAVVAIAGHIAWAAADHATVGGFVAAMLFAVAIARYLYLTRADDMSGDAIAVLRDDPVLLGIAAGWTVALLSAAGL